MENSIEPIYLKDYKKPDFTCRSVELLFDIYEDETVVTNVMELSKNSSVDEIVLDSIDLELVDVYLNNLKIDNTRYSYKDEKFTIFNVPENFKLKIVNKIYPHQNTELEGLYKSGDIFCTQNEPEGFRRITPFLDRPDVMAIYTTTVVADKLKYPILLSNGNKVKCYDSLDGRHGVTWFDPHPKPSYLFAVVAGDLGVVNDGFVTMHNKNVELNIYCDKGNEKKCSYAMTSLKKAMKWDEEVYGREYDLDIYNIVAVDSFNMGAMENKGLNIFNSAYVLADEESATDTNYMGIESVIAHEYFHNWTGNRITCRDWFQLTLKEGLTVFRDQCFSADMNSKEVQRIEDVRALRERQFVEDASPTAHPIQPKSYISMNNFYTSTVYEKGAEVIRMIHTLIGEQNFRKSMDLYFEKFDGQAVTTDDFLWAMENGSGHNFSKFRKWYDESGTPKIVVNENFEKGVYTLNITQKQTPFYFPLKIGLIDGQGKEIVDDMLIIENEEEIFSWNLDEKPVLSINRDFSAPIIVENKNTNFSFLMKYDKNSFTKYESAQTFAIKTIQQIMKNGTVDDMFIESYGYLLSLDLELSYKALLLELPTVSMIMQEESSIDFDVICESIETLSTHLAKTYKSELLDIYKRDHNPFSKDLDSLHVGKRAMKNRVLKLLSFTNDEDVVELVKQQYYESFTMTDKICALGILENTTNAKDELEDFYSKYKNNSLVMNKYFATIASSKKDGVLKKVQELQNDELYDEKVPNLVRSLLGSFSRNYKHFHKKDGSGYIFLAKKILELDKINPQISSSLMGAFKIYPKMNEKNKQLMKKELECVVSTHSLSKNCFEIVSKILS